jgi:hypothetical protein
VLTRIAAGVLLLGGLAGCGSDAPEASECARLWNQSENLVYRAEAVAMRASEAAVRGAESNPGRWGPACAVAVRAGEHGAWLLCFNELEVLRPDSSR